MAYFQAKSLSKQRTGRTIIINQNTGLSNSFGRTPAYSVLNPSFGATVAYIGRKMNQMPRLPGIAMTLYYVQMLVIRAAFPRVVIRPAV